MKNYIGLGNDIIATDDDGDGIFDDVHHVTRGTGGVLHYDDDGDGIYDDSSFAVSLSDNTNDENSHHVYHNTHHGKNSHTSFGRSDSIFSGKKKLKIIIAVVVGLFAFSMLTKIFFIILGLLVL